MNKLAEKKIPVALKMDPSLHKDLKIHCIQKDVSVQDFVDRAIRVALTREPKQRKEN